MCWKIELEDNDVYSRRDDEVYINTSMTMICLLKMMMMMYIYRMMMYILMYTIY